MLVSVMVTTEAWDCPPVSCVLIARPTKLPGLYAQMVGRGLRLSEGKTDCLVLDAVGVSRQQKLVTLVDMMPSAVYDSSELSTARRRTAGDSSKRTANGTTSTANRRRVRYADVELLPEPSRWARLRVWLSGRLSPAA